MYDIKKGLNTVKQSSYKMAIKFYKKIFNNKYAQAHNLNLGFMYANGKGVKQDYATAAKYYQKACDGGNAEGCYNLGLMYAYGKGVKQDYATAAKYYTKAYNGGCVAGCHNLGFMYANGYPSVPI